MLYLSGVGLAIFLLLLLIAKDKKVQSDWVLACWLLVMAIHLLLFSFEQSGIYPELLGAALPFPLLHGPLLYIYTRSLTRYHSLSYYQLLHFLPATLVVLYMIPFFGIPTEEKIEVFRNNGAGYENFNLIRHVAVMTSGILYVILSTIALMRHRARIASLYSNTEKVNLLWLQYMIFWIAAIWLFVLTHIDELVFGAAVLFVGFIGYFGIRQMGIFNNPSPEEKGLTAVGETDAVSTLEKPKYQKSGLSAEAAEKIHKGLTQVMHDEKLFTQSDLSLADLATRLNTPANHLSQVINEREGKNFYDYVNNLRIQEFIRVTGSPESQKYTLQALAEEAGFSSKSSFNRHFRKVTGKSPSEYLQTKG
ncbi:MAG: AraC family transcriptional regulator [Bacteroidetes bacterium]|nr:AraC family transcriptional regulator [Bacteroidota bacterium]